MTIKLTSKKFFSGNPPRASHLTQNKIQSFLCLKPYMPVSGYLWNYFLLLLLSLTLLLWHWPSCRTLQYTPTQGFCTCCPLCLELLPQTAAQFAPSLPSGLCSNTFLSERPSLLPNIKEQETMAINPTIFSPPLTTWHMYLSVSFPSLFTRI